MAFLTGFKVGESPNLAIALPTYSTTYYLDGVPIYYDMEGYYYPDQLNIPTSLPQGIKTFVRIISISNFD